jgi:amino acid permease
MKIISFIVTLFMHFLIILSLKLLDNFNTILIIVFASTIIGLSIKLFYKNHNTNLNHLGWGILYGSLTAFISILLFTTYIL